MGGEGHPWYEPPEFDLYEYDDAYVELGPHLHHPGAAQRWLLGHHGQVGHPAEEVHVAWGTGQDIAVVWSGRRRGSAPDVAARITAATMALDGPVAWFTQQGPPRGATADVFRVAESADLWFPHELAIDRRTYSGFGARIDEVRVAYAVLENDLIVGIAGTSTATRGRDLPLTLRTLANPASYSLDPGRPHRTVDNAAEWARFLDFHAISQDEDR